MKCKCARCINSIIRSIYFCLLFDWNFQKVFFFVKTLEESIVRGFPNQRNNQSFCVQNIEYCFRHFSASRVLDHTIQFLCYHTVYDSYLYILCLYMCCMPSYTGSYLMAYTEREHYQDQIEHLEGLEWLVKYSACG